LAFAAKQTQIKTFDVNLLAEAKNYNQIGRREKISHSLSLSFGNLHNKCVYEFRFVHKCINYSLNIELFMNYSLINAL